MNQIGRYEILGEIGRGGMAVVFRARDPNFNRDVAIKVLPRELLHDANFKARFQREAQTIAALEHPAIVPVHDFGEQDGQPYLVMRFMPGGSLADRLKRGPVSLNEALRIVGQLAPALDRAHLAGIVHRDLKPANILFDREENAYIADFGLAKLANADVNLSATAVYGTPAYMSPEQAKGVKEIDGRADLYALGVVAYQMLAGRVPYEADTPIALALKHVMEPAPRLRDARPDLPERADLVLQRAMAKDPRDRYATASHLHAALMASLQTQPQYPGASAADAITTPLPQASVGTTQTPAASRSNRGLWIGCGVVGALGVLAVASIGLGGLIVGRGLLGAATATRPAATATVVAVAPTRTLAPVTEAPAPTRTQTPAATDSLAPTEPVVAPVAGDLRLIGDVLFAPGPADPRVVYAHAYSIAANGGVIAAVNPQTGIARWQIPIAEADQRPALAFGGDSLAIFNGDVLSVVERDTGDERWRATLSDVAPSCRRSACVQIVGDVVVAETVDGAVHGYSVDVGEPLWRYELTADAIGFDVIGEHIVVIDADAADQGMLAFVNPVDGAATTVAPVCRAGGLPDSMTANATFVPAPAEKRLLVVFGFFGTCLTTLDLEHLEAPATTIVVAGSGGLETLPVVANANGAYVTLDNAVYWVDPETQTGRELLKETDVTFQAVAALELGVLVWRTETRGSPSSALELIDPTSGETRWSIDLGKGQPYPLGVNTLLDDSATYFSVARGVDGTAIVLRHGTAADMNGPIELVADVVDLDTGALQPLARFSLTQQSPIASIPEPLIWVQGGAWLGLDGGLIRLDWASSEITTVFPP